MKGTEREHSNKNLQKGLLREKGFKHAEMRVKSLFRSIKKARKHTQSNIDRDLLLSRIDYKLAQRLDSQGSHSTAEGLRNISEKERNRSGFKLSSIFAFLKGRSRSQWLAMGAGSMTLMIVLFGATAFGLVYFRGTDIPILRNMSEQSTPVISLAKSSESEYGVATEEGIFTITVASGEAFRSLGLVNKVSISPDVPADIEVSSDLKSLIVKPLEELKPDTEYTVTLRKGTMFNDGSSLPRDYAWVFWTEPVFAVTGITPRDGSTTAPVDTSIEVEFTHKDIDIVTFQDYFTVEPAIAGRFEQYNKKIIFLPSSNLVPGTEYKVTVREGFNNSKGEGISSGATSRFKVGYQTSDEKYLPHPSMSWSDSSPIISTTREPWIGIRSYELTGPITFTLYQADKDDLLASMRNYRWSLNEKPSSLGEAVREFSLTPQQANFFEIDLDGYGIYLLEANNSSYGRSIYKYLVFSPLGAVYSESISAAQTWVFDMNTKKPVGGADVVYYDLKGTSQAIGSGKTDSNGYFRMNSSDVDFAIISYAGNYVVGGSKIKHEWYSSEVFDDGTDLTHRAFVLTDRPLYKAGDTLNFNAILRKEIDMNYSIPEKRVVTVRLGDKSYWWYGLAQLPYYEETFEVSKDFGTVSGSISLPGNIPTGTHNLSVYVDGKSVGGSTIVVSEYEKPLYSYNLSVDKTRAFAGEKLKVTITGKDYSGDPASEQSVGLSVVQIYNIHNTEVSWAESSEDLQGLPWGSTNTVLHEIVTLDPQGHTEIEIPLSLYAYQNGFVTYRITLWSQENYTELDSKRVTVAESTHGLFVKASETSVQEDDGNKIQFKTARIWDLEPEGGVRVKYSVRRSWTEWEESGQTYYDPVTKANKPIYSASTVHSDVLYDKELTTDAQGMAEITMSDLKHGSYTVTADFYHGTSQYMRRFAYVFYVYTPPSDDEYVYSDWNNASDKLKIYTDKESYVPGETATIAVKTTLDGNGVYLVRRGEVMSWRMLDLTSGFVEIQQEIGSGMSPYIEVCVWGVDEYQSMTGNGITTQNVYLSNILRSNCIPLTVQEDRGRLQVNVRTSKPSFEPGEDANLYFDITDSSGKGVKAEVAVSVVDKALIDIYEKNSGDVTLQKNIYDSFYTIVRQRVYQMGFPFDYEYSGNSGGGGGGGENAPRTDFRDTAYWNGKVQTDKDGKATVSFKLPDNLTTWTVRAHAISEETKAGKGMLDFIVSKDVRIETKPPAFIRSGDTFVLEIGIANYSTSDLSGTVSVNCEGCEVPQYNVAVRQTKDSRGEIALSITPSGESTLISLDSALIVGGTVMDALEVDIPVLNNGFEVSTSQSVLLNESAKEQGMEFSVERGASVNRSNLVVTLSRGFMSEDDLFPYDPTVKSTYDLSGAIIQNAFLYKHYDEISPSLSELEIESRVKNFLELLFENQSETGGFGWFDYDVINYDATIYAANAVAEAKKSGIEVNVDRIDAIEQVLLEGMVREDLSLEQRVYSMYVLALLDSRNSIPTMLVMKKRLLEIGSDEELSSIMIANLMRTLEEFGSIGDAGELIPLLFERAQISQRGASWNDSNSTVSSGFSTSYVTAIVADALYPFSENDLYKKTINWLVSEGLSGCSNSYEKVTVLQALGKASLDGLDERQDSGIVSVIVNGDLVKNVEIAGEKGSAETTRLVVNSSYLKVGENVVKLELEGGGVIYAVATLTSTSETLSQDNEFSVKRHVIDFNTKRQLTSVSKGDVVMVRTEVTPDRDGSNLVVTDVIPSGFEPIRYELGAFNYDFYSRWWKWGQRDMVNRYGSVALDRVTFTQYAVEGGKTYVFEYPVVAAYGGEFSAGSAQAYFLEFGDIGGNSVLSTITVTR